MDMVSYLLGKTAGKKDVKLQEKNVTVTENGESVISPDEGYKGLSGVNLSVNVLPTLQSKEVTITENKTTTITPDEDYDGLSSVSVTTNIDTSNLYFNTLVTGGMSSWLGYNYLTGVFPDVVVPENYSNIYWLYKGWNFSKAPKVIFGDYIQSFYQACHQNSILTEIDCSGWNGTNVTDFGECFVQCSQLKKLDLSNIAPVGTIAMYSTFENCNQLEEIDISNIESVGSLRQTFYGCTHLQKIDMRKMLLSLSTNHSQTFQNVPTSCLIIVKDATEKAWMNTNFPTYTNVKTAEEYEASL